MIGKLARVAAICVAAMASEGRATEYDMSIYILPEPELSAAIGSGDAALRDAMLGDAAYVDRMGLDQRFAGGGWRPVVGQLIEGTPGRDEFANGFALELLLRQLTPPADRFEIGLPFASLAESARLMRAAGADQTADFLNRLEYGVRQDDAGLAAKLGATEYPASVWAVDPDQAAILLEAVPHIRAVSRLLEAYGADHDSAAAGQARDLITSAVLADIDQYAEFRNPAPTEADRAEAVARELKDPYSYDQSIGMLAEELDVIASALERAQGEGKLAVFVYRSW